MTKLVTLKKPEQVALKGVSLDWTIEDGSVTRLCITDKHGVSITLAKGESYSRGMTVMAPPPVVMADRFALVGKVKGVRVKELFKDESEAKRTIDGLTQFGSVENTLELKPVTVPVDDEGEVAIADEEIPF